MYTDDSFSLRYSLYINVVFLAISPHSLHRCIDVVCRDSKMCALLVFDVAIYILIFSSFPVSCNLNLIVSLFRV